MTKYPMTKNLKEVTPAGGHRKDEPTLFVIRISGFLRHSYYIPHLYHPAGHHLCPQAATVDQRPRDPCARKFFQVAAGLTQFNTTQQGIAYMKLSADQVIQRHALGQ